jgi:hypothetical protein
MTDQRLGIRTGSHYTATWLPFTPAFTYLITSAFDRGCVKTQNWFDFRGALTIPDTKQIEYRAFLGVIFNWHGLCSAFSHNLDPLQSLTLLKSSRSTSEVRQEATRWKTDGPGSSNKRLDRGFARSNLNS